MPPPDCRSLPVAKPLIADFGKLALRHIDVEVVPVIVVRFGPKRRSEDPARSLMRLVQERLEFRVGVGR